jgi:hypothetical protein
MYLDAAIFISILNNKLLVRYKEVHGSCSKAKEAILILPCSVVAVCPLKRVVNLLKYTLVK